MSFLGDLNPKLSLKLRVGAWSCFSNSLQCEHAFIANFKNVHALQENACVLI